MCLAHSHNLQAYQSVAPLLSQLFLGNWLQSRQLSLFMPWQPRDVLWKEVTPQLNTFTLGSSGVRLFLGEVVNGEHLGRLLRIELSDARYDVLKENLTLFSCIFFNGDFDWSSFLIETLLNFWFWLSSLIFFKFYHTFKRPLLTFFGILTSTASDSPPWIFN